MEKYHSEGIEAIFSADTSIRQKYNAIMRIDPYESNNQAVFEVMLKEIMDNKVEKYEPYLTAILSKIDSVKILKKAFIDDTRTDVEGKSSRRKAIIQRMQELIGIEADRFLLDIVGTETEPIMLFDYVDKRQAMREIREWAVKRDSNSDNDLSLVEYIDKHYKKKLR